MKTSKRFLSLVTVLLLSICATSFAQTEHLVTLHVDTDGTYSFSVFPESSFLSGDTPETFSILVDTGDTIKWEGVAESGAIVDIESIDYVAQPNNPKSKNLFSKKKIKGVKDNSNKKKVKAKVKRNKKNAEYKYIIEFTIDDVADSIDPEIKVKS